ncbi:MAG: hypothetical protein ACM3SW_15185 [Actinomycetota bacterium]
MRPAVLSIAKERSVSPLRNAVLAHAGYGVIPATSFDSALKILRRRHVCAIVIDQSLESREQRALCAEATQMGIPSMVLDPYSWEDDCLLHVNPLDGPEMFLDALASLLQRDHMACCV